MAPETRRRGPASERETGWAVQVDGLVKEYGQVRAVAGVTFAVRAGEFFALLGPNGAGKTTTLRVLTTLARPTAGRALVAGADVVQEPRTVRRRIGLVFQELTLDEQLTARENLLFHARLYGVPAAEAQRRAEALLAAVGLLERQHDLVSTFSGGMKRRLEIARAMLHRPRVLFLDEPTIGLDPEARRRIWEYVAELRAQEGTTVVLTTHYMDEAEQCDRVAVMDRGQLVALDTPSALKRLVGGDVVTIEAEKPQQLAAAVAERFGLPAQLVDGRVVVEHEDGAAFVAQVAAAFPERVRAVAFHRPPLDDVYIKLTGRGLQGA